MDLHLTVNPAERDLLVRLVKDEASAARRLYTSTDDRALASGLRRRIADLDDLIERLRDAEPE